MVTELNKVSYKAEAGIPEGDYAVSCCVHEDWSLEVNVGAVRI